MLRSKQKTQSGFTLIETIVVIGILVIVMFGIYLIYTGFYNVYNSQQAQINVSSSAGQSIYEVENYTLQADQVLSSHSFSATTYTTDADTLVLEIPSIDSSGDIVSSKYDYVAFYLSGNNFYRILAPDASSSRKAGTRQLSNAAQSLTFTYDTATMSLVKEVTIDFTTQTTVRGKIISNHLHQILHLRNSN